VHAAHSWSGFEQCECSKIEQPAWCNTAGARRQPGKPPLFNNIKFGKQPGTRARASGCTRAHYKPGELHMTKDSVIGAASRRASGIRNRIGSTQILNQKE
jgi:hypothetical protein